jgi:hypothetical protein
VVRRWPVLMILRWVFTLGLFYFWWQRCYMVLTTDRLLYGRGIVFSKMHRAVPINRIQDATYSRALIAGRVSISSAGGGLGVDVLKSVRPGAAKAFVQQVQDAARQKPHVEV